MPSWDPLHLSLEGAAPVPTAATSKTLFSSLLFGCRRIQLLFPPTLCDYHGRLGVVESGPGGVSEVFFLSGPRGAAEGTLPRLDSKVLGTRGSVDEEHAIDAEQNERESRVAADAIDAKRTYDDVRRRRDLYASSPRKPEERRNEKHT